MIRLSILIATLESRRVPFGKLCDHIQGQATDEVEVLFSCDNGEASIGAKRQSLLQNATGTFITYVDDDDKVPGNYVSAILPHCKNGVDCIGYKIACYGYDKYRPRLMEPACVSNRYREWKENVDGFRYVRCPHHLVPVRREHALKVGFDVRSKYGEDAKYSFGLRDRRLLRKEAFIDEFMYTILHNPNKRFGQ